MPDSLAYPTHPGANLMLGASSPLWGYFATAAAGGVTLWWMSRWARTDGIEALLAAAPAPVVPAPEIPEPAALPPAVLEPAETEAEAPFVPAAEAVTSEASGDVEAVVEAEAPVEASSAPAANDVEPSEAKTA